MSVDTAARATAKRTSGVGRLVLVELRRYGARAGVRWLLVAMLGIVAMTAFAAYRSSIPPTQAQLDEAQRVYAEQLDSWEENGERQIQDCRDAEAAERERNPDEPIDFGCEGMTAPEPEWFLPHRTTFAEAASGWVEQLSTFLLLVTVVVGATFVAAEFSSGSISTWLTFEPRRGRVFASKVAVAALVTGVAVLVASAVFVGAAWLVCRVNGALGDVTPELWADVTHRVLRTGALSVGTAALGAALAFLLRHTAAAIAVVFAWMVILENILSSFVEGYARWTVQTNMTAWIQGGLTRQVGSTMCSTDASGVTTCDGESLTVTMAQSGVFLLGVVVAVTAVAFVVFRRRDVA